MGLVTGALVAFGGASIVKGIWSVIEGHRELNRELERTKQLGGEFAATVPQARANAFQMNRDVPPLDAAEAVRLHREETVMAYTAWRRVPGQARSVDAGLGDAGSPTRCGTGGLRATHLPCPGRAHPGHLEHQLGWPADRPGCDWPPPNDPVPF